MAQGSSAGGMAGKLLALLALAGGLCACSLRQPDVALTLAPDDAGTPVATAARQEPSRTPIPPMRASSTPLASPTPSPEPAQPPATATRLATSLLQLFGSPSPRATPPATWTPVQLPATWTAVPEQSQFWTAVAATQPTLRATTQRQGFGVTETPSPTATRFQPTVAVRRDLLRPAMPRPRIQPTSLRISAASAYHYDVKPGQTFVFEGIALRDGVRLFLPNPADSSSYLHTDDKGILRYRAPGAVSASEMIWSPFHAGYSSGVDSIERNKHRIVELDWSADGQRFSFRIDTPPGLDNSAAGVWFWQPQIDPAQGATYQVVRDCAHDGYRPCQFVNRSNAAHWKTVDMQWSPVAGDYRLLLTVRLPDEGRNALALVEARRDPTYANNAPYFVRYDYGHWDADGRHITVSGRRPDGRVVIAQVNAALENERVILDGAASGLWLRDAARRPDGRILALGRPGAPGSGPLALYDGQGRRISDFVGDAAPDSVRWHLDRSMVTLSVSGRQYSLRVMDGAIIDASALTSRPQFSQVGLSQPPIPEAVAPGAAYYPGQQLRVIARGLNLRQSPDTDAPIMVTLAAGDYVAIFAGPYDNQGYRWWRVQTAQSRFGWIAGRVADRPTIAPA